jgi:hypothetical protein
VGLAGLAAGACSDSATGSLVTGQLDVAAGLDGGGVADLPTVADAHAPDPTDAAGAADGPAGVDGAAGDAPPPAEVAGDVALGGFAYLVIEPPALDFGVHPVGGFDARDVELENAGDKGLTISSIALVDGSEAFATNLTQVFLGPGQKKTLKVSFFALDAGVFADTVRFQSNAINGAFVDLSLLGEGRAPVCDDLDGDGHGPGCSAGADCNESDPAVFFGAPERCNGLDDDCDGLHDEDFVGLGAACEVGFGACVAAGAKVCGADGVSLKCSVNPVTGGDELCNEVDDDCDGATDEDFASKGKLCTVGLGACAVSDKYVCNSDGTALVCNVSPGTPGPEICGDGVDNDCDPATVCYTLAQGNQLFDVTPIAGDEGVASFYGYQWPSQASANTGYEVSNRATVMLYESPSGGVSLVFILDKTSDGSGGQVGLSYSGATGMQVLVYDDLVGAGNDVWSIDDTNGSGQIQWTWGACCTDGFALGFLEGEFCIDLTFLYAFGINGLAIYTGPGAPVLTSSLEPFRVCGAP